MKSGAQNNGFNRVRKRWYRYWCRYALCSISWLKLMPLFLLGRKYLDALCVYLWATTPVLISVLTFVTFVLLGNTLTAAKEGHLLHPPLPFTYYINKTVLRIRTVFLDLDSYNMDTAIFFNLFWKTYKIYMET